MNKDTKIKIFLSVIYLLILSTFLWFFFNYFSIEEITSYELIRKNRDFLMSFKQNNFLIILLTFYFFTVIWVLLLGFGSPVALVAGFLFGKWIGTFIVTVSLASGATFLYLFANYFLKDLLEKKFHNKFILIKEKIKRKEFLYFVLFRFIGGIPFFIANVLPVIFNIKIKNYFFGTILGILPQIFIIVSLGSGLESIINANLTPPTFFELLLSKEIYFPILGFFILLIAVYLLKKI